MLQDLNTYVSIIDGITPYAGKIPEVVRIPACFDYEGDSNVPHITQWISASIGDSNYQDVLDAWMFSEGYMRKDNVNKEIAELRQVIVKLKGGAGSGFHGHKGRPGLEGGSLPDDISTTVLSPIAARDYISKNFSDNYVNSLLPNERGAILYYSNYGSAKINAYLRGDKTTNSDDLDTVISDLDSAFSKGELDKSITVYRGTNLLQDYKVGDTILDYGFISTTLAVDKAKSFAGWYEDRNAKIISIFRIRLDKGTKVVCPDPLVSIETDGSGLEQELVLQRQSKFRVIGISDKKINDMRYRYNVATQHNEEINYERTLRFIDLIQDYAVNKEIIVILKGGVGSGFHGHKGRPGEVGGSLPEGSSATTKVKEPSIIDVENSETRERLRVELKSYAEEFGFPADKISYVNSAGSAFTVGNNAYQCAAKFDPKTGTITCYAGTIEFDNGIMHFNKPIIAHEVMHYKFRLFEQQLHRQEAILDKATDKYNDTNPYCQDNNSASALKPEYEDQFWAYMIKEDNYAFADMRTNLLMLPVTDYGESYANVARQATYGLATSNAISENLGEIAASTIEDGYRDNYISKDWAKLYNAINQGLYLHKLIPTYPKIVLDSYEQDRISGYYDRQH